MISLEEAIIELHFRGYSLNIEPYTDENTRYVHISKDGKIYDFSGFYDIIDFVEEFVYVE